MGDFSKAEEIDSRYLDTGRVVNSRVEKIKQNAKKVFNKITDKKEQSGCTGSYQVSGYTRSDGKEVKPYTRNCYVHGK